MKEWQPIETAPRDGTRILAFFPKDGITIIYWSGSNALWRFSPDTGSEFGYEFQSIPLNWMPLPKPPTSNNN